MPCLGDSDRLSGFTLPEVVSDFGNLLILMQTITVIRNTPNTANASKATTAPTIISSSCAEDKLDAVGMDLDVGMDVDVGNIEVCPTVCPPVILLLSIVCTLDVAIDEGLTSTWSGAERVRKIEM